MKLNHLNRETVENLRNLIGGQIRGIFVEGGRIEKSENMVLAGGGLISMIVVNGNRKYKWRLQFHEETNEEFYSEFYEWETPPSIKERYNPRTGEVNYDRNLGEDFTKYHLAIEISPKEKEDIQLMRKIKSIKIYHYVGEFDEDEKYDYLAIIDIETETGRRIIIEEDDPKNSFYIYFDELKTIDFKLAEIHDDSGNTFGKKRYQLRHEICQNYQDLRIFRILPM